MAVLYTTELFEFGHNDTYLYTSDPIVVFIHKFVNVTLLILVEDNGIKFEFVDTIVNLLLQNLQSFEGGSEVLAHKLLQVNLLLVVHLHELFYCLSNVVNCKNTVQFLDLLMMLNAAFCFTYRSSCMACQTRTYVYNSLVVHSAHLLLVCLLSQTRFIC